MNKKVATLRTWAVFSACAIAFTAVHAQSAETTQTVLAIEKPAERQWADARVDELNQRARGMGLVPFPLAQQYLNGLYQKLKVAAGVPGWPGNVHIVATPGLQAYATASGNLYIGLQWLVEAQSDDEIVGLLAHEFGHAYLHYHQVDGVVKSADDLVNMTATVALLAGKVAGVNDLISGSLVYQTGRELGRSHWGQSQEYAADMFAMKLTRKLGYSYSDGIKTVLERIGSWEKALVIKNQKLKEQAAEDVRANIEAAELAALTASTGKQNDNQFNRTLNGWMAAAAGAIGKFQHQFGKELDVAFSGLTQSHPPTLDREDRLAAVVEKEPVFQEESEASVQGLNSLRASPQFKSLTEAYKLAEFAFGHLGTKEGFDAMRTVVQMENSRFVEHSYIALAGFRTIAAIEELKKTTLGPDRVKASLEPNLMSASHRSWMVVTEAAYYYRKRGMISAADAIWNGYWGTQFIEAPETWPTVIAYLIDIGNYQNAKQIAADCVNKHPYYAKACNQASQTPNEKAESEKQGEAWAQETLKRWGVAPK